MTKRRPWQPPWGIVTCWYWRTQACTTYRCWVIRQFNETALQVEDCGKQLQQRTSLTSGTWIHRKGISSHTTTEAVHELANEMPASDIVTKNSSRYSLHGERTTPAESCGIDIKSTVKYDGNRRSSTFRIRYSRVQFVHHLSLSISTGKNFDSADQRQIHILTAGLFFNAARRVED